jgi:hypothetical protein
MKVWIKNNINNIIIGSFLIPILLVAFVSISHVTTFYGLSNPFSWAIYLSVAVEIAALASLAGISAKFGKFIYIPFGIVTLIQLVGNFFYSYSFVDMDSESFKNWVDMTSGIFEVFGVETTNVLAHRRILAFLTGGMIPFISLTFAHMLIVYSSKLQEFKSDSVNTELDEKTIEQISKKIASAELQDIKSRWIPTQSELEEFEKNLSVEQNTDQVTVHNTDQVNEQMVEEVSQSIPTEEQILVEPPKNRLVYTKNV